VRVINLAQVGWLMLDTYLVGPSCMDDRPPPRFSSMSGNPPDHILLWRLLAHAPNTRLGLLADTVPDAAFPPAQVPAFPSDEALLTYREKWRTPREWATFDQHSDYSHQLGVAPDETSRRISTLNLIDPLSSDTASRTTHVHSPGEPTLDISRISEFSEHGFPLDLVVELLSSSGPIALYQLLRMSEASGRSLQNVAERLRGLGFEVPDVADTIRASIARLPGRSQRLP